MNKELDELIAENDKLEWTCREFRKLWIEAKKENNELRKIIQKLKGVTHE